MRLRLTEVARGDEEARTSDCSSGRREEKGKLGVAKER